MSYLFIPKEVSLQIDELIEEQPPKFKPFKKDKALYIIHLIQYIPVYNKDISKRNFVPINSTLLKEKIYNYRNYIEYLQDELKLIECDEQYIIDKKSKGYKLSNKYNSLVSKYKVSDFTLVKALKRDKVTIRSFEKSLDYLNKWFFNGLEIDLDFVKSFLDRELEMSSMNKDKSIRRYNTSYLSIEKIHKKDFFIKRDDNVQRFHSNLTNMRSILRNGLSYKGDMLVSIDVKNCQPYLSTLLLKKSFWLNERYLPMCSNGEPISIIKDNSKQNIYKYNLCNYIMLGEVLKTLENSDFKKYIDLVVSGNLYEYMQDKINYCSPGRSMTRKEVKKVIFQVLFTDNRFIAEKRASSKRLFKVLFPEVYEVFKIIKRKDKKILPRLLQLIESNLIIDIISYRIAKEYPEAPLYTIHDSIVTTQQYQDKVRIIMEEELELHIGHKPSLSIETWCKQNMNSYLEKMQEKVISIV